MNYLEITCMNKGCGSKFRVPEFVRPNSTIKTKLEQECRKCINAKLLKKAKFDTKKTREKKQLNLLREKAKSQTFKNSKKGPGKKQQKKRNNTPWKEKGLNALIQHVQYNICNPYIRARDISKYNNKCISCNASITQAGHRYSVGDFPGMRFLVNNIHGQEISCNHYKSGNIDAFDRGLNARHGDGYTNDLKMQSYKYTREGHKWYRFDVIEIGVTYKYLHKNKIWIFTQKEFNHFRKIANK